MLAHFTIMTKRIDTCYATGKLLTFFIATFGITIFLSSCLGTKDSYYFKTLKKDTTIRGFVSSTYESKIIKGDKLSIQVTSLSPEEDRLFNQASGTGLGSAGFLVNADGTVLLHRLGNTNVAGYTRKELSEKLQQALLPYMKEPIVNVNYLNHKVIVLGEVGRPQVLNMPEEPINLIELLVLSGDVTKNGKRDNITIIREEGTQKIVRHVNLEDHSIFTSPWYYIQPNDIVYVFPDSEKYINEENRRKVLANLGLVSTISSFVFIILSRIIK